MNRLALTVLALTSLIAVGLCETTTVCHDIDTMACQSIAQHDPDICNKPGIAEAACPRFCNLCYKTCFLCAAPVRDASGCNRTVACAKDEQCFVRTVTSSRDGHVEHTMGCSTTEQCDGIVINSIVGKRDVSFHCCTDDLCNDPFGTYTTVPPTTTTPMRTTVPVPCVRDVFFMVPRSVNITRTESHQMVEFVGHVIQHFDIGHHDTLVAMATYDHDVNEIWDYHRYRVKSDILLALAHITNLHTSDNRIDYHDVVRYITNNRVDGDRLNVPSRTVIFVDHKDISHYQSELRHDPQFGSDVIVVEIGVSETMEVFSHLVPDPSHIFHVSGYGDLDSIESKLVSLICS